MGANASSPSELTPTTTTTSPRVSSRYFHHMSTSADSDSTALVRGESMTSGSEKKKSKSSKLSTLKKKLSRVRRQSRCAADYGRALRDLTSSWSVRELHSLADEYESSAALKELTVLANLARPHASTIVEDLAKLYEQKYCTDVDLVYQGTVIPAHRAILCVRCSFFRELLTRYPEYGAQVPIVIRTPGVNVSLFSALLRFLYTGDFGLDESRMHCLKKLLAQIVAEFGAPNSLEQDLRTLLDTGAYSDAVLVFTNTSTDDASTTRGTAPLPRGAPQCPHTPCPHAVSGGTLGRGGGVAKNDGTVSMMRRYRNELRCHRAILAARSTFFRNLELRRCRSGEELTERALNTPSYIVLDESVIPKRYARVLLSAIYLDHVDLAGIIRTSVSVPLLGGDVATLSHAVTSQTSHGSSSGGSAAGAAAMTPVDEAMELYHIGQFLEISALAHGCEDIIAESLSVDNLATVLQWSGEAHGSAWVQRQAMHFLTEEFLQVVNSAALPDLSKDHLLQAIQSDFLQAREIDVLSAIIKWAELKLIKRLEEREPNLLSHTAHSISRKGIKKKDLNDAELREILADLLPYVRTCHIMPVHNDVLMSAIKRGLVSVPPAHLLGGGGGAGEGSTASAWVHTRNVGLFVKPRLFLPYYEELKTILKEQSLKTQDTAATAAAAVGGGAAAAMSSNSSSCGQLHVVHMCTKPDALYMLEDRMYAAVSAAAPQAVVAAGSSQQLQQHWAGCPSATVDIIAGTIPVPEREVLQAMQRRDADLRRSKAAQRAYALVCTNKAAVTHQIHLRVVREFGLPNSTVQILQDCTSSSSSISSSSSTTPLYHHHHRGGGVGGGLAQRGACYLSPARSGGRGGDVSCHVHTGGGGLGEAHCRCWSLQRGVTQPPELLQTGLACAAISCRQRGDSSMLGGAGSLGAASVWTTASSTMPDIAMAMPSSAPPTNSNQDPTNDLDDLSQHDLDLSVVDLGHADLDLGDGANHYAGGGGGGGAGVGGGKSSMYI